MPQLVKHYVVHKCDDLIGRKHNLKQETELG